MYVLSGSKQFRKNGGPHLKGSRRPRKKVAIIGLCSLGGLKSYFSEPKRIFFFFFSTPSRNNAVRRPNNFFDPPPKNFRPPIFFRSPIFFSAAFVFFWRLKPKLGFFGGRLRSTIFRRPSGKTSAFFFFSAPPRYGVRRPNNFFDAPKIFFGGFFYFLGDPKNRRFLAPKTKNRLSRRAS